MSLSHNIHAWSMWRPEHTWAGLEQSLGVACHIRLQRLAQGCLCLGDDADCGPLNMFYV